MAQKLTIVDMHKVAKTNGGKCLEKTYTNSSIPMLWECREGHKFKKKYNKIQQGSWCSESICNPKSTKKKTTEYMHSFAKERGGFFLSPKYGTSSQIYLWKCEFGHKWEAKYASLQSGRWCTTCAAQNRRKNKRRHSLRTMAELGKEQGFKVLSKVELINSKQKIEIKFIKCKHIQSMTASSLIGTKNRKPRGCKTCAGNQPTTLEDIEKFSKSSKILYEDSEIRNGNSIIRWTCQNGHSWNASFNSARLNGCSSCNASESMGERVSRFIFETIFSKNFVKTPQPMWLKKEYNETKTFILDGYCEELKLAFEHHGRQHFKFNKKFHRSDIRNFHKQVEDDSYKEVLAGVFGVRIIVIEELGHYHSYDQAFEIILEKLKKRNIELPSNIDKMKIDLSKIFYGSNKIDPFREIAKKMKLKIPKQLYRGTNKKHLIVCLGCGEEFKKVLYQLDSSSGCPACWKKDKASRSKYNIADIRVASEKAGLKLISKKFNGLDQSYTLKCSKGHIVKKTGKTIMYSQSSCAKCRVRTLDDCIDHAKDLGGKCLSKKYINAHQVMNWKCKEGHQFKKQVNDVLNCSKWCPHCAGTSHLLRK